jgi:hypothetical protein
MLKPSFNGNATQIFYDPGQPKVFFSSGGYSIFVASTLALYNKSLKKSPLNTLLRLSVVYPRVDHTGISESTCDGNLATSLFSRHHLRMQNKV